MTDRLTRLFLDSLGGGAWPFQARGVICLVNSDNDRDSSQLTRLRIAAAFTRASTDDGILPDSGVGQR